MGPTKSQAEEAARICEELSEIGFVMPGTLTKRYTVCGRSGCKCGADPPRPHGPYFYWTRKADQKTVGRNLDPEEVEVFGPWFENAKRLRVLVGRLEALGFSIFESQTKRGGKTPPPGQTPTGRRGAKARGPAR